MKPTFLALSILVFTCTLSAYAGKTPIVVATSLEEVKAQLDDLRGYQSKALSNKDYDLTVKLLLQEAKILRNSGLASKEIYKIYKSGHPVLLKFESDSKSVGEALRMRFDQLLSNTESSSVNIESELGLYEILIKVLSSERIDADYKKNAFSAAVWRFFTLGGDNLVLLFWMQSPIWGVYFIQRTFPIEQWESASIAMLSIVLGVPILASIGSGIDYLRAKYTGKLVVAYELLSSFFRRKLTLPTLYVEKMRLKYAINTCQHILDPSLVNHRRLFK